ncbi:unnamed protein product [Ostreobium quekettii]|uniref:Uncharacterized protein n=1 Tax=Ostreobium quekettii TaxID=121088 RepID=A0A8S1IUT0_9CHLO|nr:unnamed protein product [Ostreobium quekettii]
MRTGESKDDAHTTHKGFPAQFKVMKAAHLSRCAQDFDNSQMSAPFLKCFTTEPTFRLSNAATTSVRLQHLQQFLLCHPVTLGHTPSHWVDCFPHCSCRMRCVVELTMFATNRA